MKKLMKTVTILCLSAGILVLTGCNTTGNNQKLIDVAAATIQVGSQAGATYAIQQDTNNIKWFRLANTSIKTFATGENLTPTEFEKQLWAVSPSLENQWIQLGIDSVVVLYDVSYNDYVISQVNSNVIAKQFLTAVTTGFDKALLPYDITTMKILKFTPIVKVERPSVVSPKHKK